MNTEENSKTLIKLNQMINNETERKKYYLSINDLNKLISIFTEFTCNNDEGESKTKEETTTVSDNNNSSVMVGYGCHHLHHKHRSHKKNETTDETTTTASDDNSTVIMVGYGRVIYAVNSIENILFCHNYTKRSASFFHH